MIDEVVEKMGKIDVSVSRKLPLGSLQHHGKELTMQHTHLFDPHKVANAGIAAVKAVHECTGEDLKRMMDVNVRETALDGSKRSPVISE